MSSLLEKVTEKTQEHSGLSKCLAVSAGVYVGYTLYNMANKSRVHKKIRNKIKKKEGLCKAAFAQVEQNLQKMQLTPEEYTRILELPIADLLEELKTNKISSSCVLHVYQSQALNVNKRLNCITEPILEAETLASICDSNNDAKGPLHGIPVSIKENYDLDGNDSTAGMGQYLGDLQAEDAVLVKVLKKQGAIPYVRTNIPQTMMTYECSNPIYGQTNNPYDVTRGPGGSTGGEGALIGAGASILGFGSDIGGSIRAPSHFSGCYGLKTTLERLSRKGTFALAKGQTLVSGTVGPMSRDLEGLVVSMKAILCDYHFQLDPQVPPIYFRDEIYENKRPLRVGFYDNDGYIQPVPACQRAVHMAKQALEAQGHTIVSFTPPRMKHVVPNLYLKSVQGDKGKMYTTKLDRDLVDPTLKKLMFPSYVPNPLLVVMAYVLSLLTRDPLVKDLLLARRGIRSVYDWFVQGKNIQAYKDEFLAAWTAKDLDCVICPVFACSAIPHGQVFDVLVGGSYCFLYNVVNYPAGALPVTKVTKQDVDNMKQYPNTTRLHKSIRQVTEGSEGLPVGVQCVGLPFQEELVLRLMKEVETGLNKLKT